MPAAPSAPRPSRNQTSRNRTRRIRASGNRTRLAIGLLVVALIGLTAWGLFAGRLMPDNQFRSLAVGDCIRLLALPDAAPARDGSLSVGHEEAGCAAGPTPMIYTVAVTGEGERACPTTDYVEYYQVAPVSRSDATEQRQWTICLIPNFVAETCYGEDDSTLGYQAVPCGQEATLRVDSVSDRADEQCAGAGRGIVFPEPPRTVCVRPPG